MNHKMIIPAILTDNTKDLADKLNKLSGLVNWVQIDILDGKFVKNKTITIKDLDKVKLSKKFNLEAHLMVKDPEKYFKDCENIGIKRVIFHLEIAKNIKDILKKINKFSFQKGIALNPETKITKIRPYLNQIDLVLLMSVHPGFQSQKFIPSVLSKIKEIKKIAPQIKVEVDGGINIRNIKKIDLAQADYVAVGSGLFKSNDIKKQLSELKKRIN